MTDSTAGLTQPWRSAESPRMGAGGVQMTDESVLALARAIENLARAIDNHARSLPMNNAIGAGGAGGGAASYVHYLTPSESQAFSGAASFGRTEIPTTQGEAIHVHSE